MILLKLRMIAMSAIMLLTCLAQFHHHDADGCTSLTLLPGLEISFGNHSHIESDNCHNHNVKSNNPVSGCIIGPETFVAVSSQLSFLPVAVLVTVADDLIPRPQESVSPGYWCSPQYPSHYLTDLTPPNRRGPPIY